MHNHSLNMQKCIVDANSGLKNNNNNNNILNKCKPYDQMNICSYGVWSLVQCAIQYFYETLNMNMYGIAIVKWTRLTAN